MLMRVEVRLFAILREIAKQKVVLEELPDGSSISYVVSRLCERFGPSFRAQVLDERGQLSESLTVLLNGHNIALLTGAFTKLKDGDVVAIFPPVAGGKIFSPRR